MPSRDLATGGLDRSMDRLQISHDPLRTKTGPSIPAVPSNVTSLLARELTGSATMENVRRVTAGHRSESRKKAAARANDSSTSSRSDNTASSSRPSHPSALTSSTSSRPPTTSELQQSGKKAYVTRTTSLNITNEFVVEPFAHEQNPDGTVAGRYQVGEPVGWHDRAFPGWSWDHVKIRGQYRVKDALADLPAWRSQIKNGVMFYKRTSKHITFGADCISRVDVSHRPQLDVKELRKIVQSFIYFEKPLKSMYYPENKTADLDHAFKGEAPTKDRIDFGLCSDDDYEILLEETGEAKDHIFRFWMAQAGDRGKGGFGLLGGGSTEDAHLFFIRPMSYSHGDRLVEWIDLLLNFISAALALEGGPMTLRKYPANKIGLCQFMSQRTGEVVSIREGKGRDGHPTTMEVLTPKMVKPGKEKWTAPAGVIRVTTDNDIRRVWDRIYS